MFKVRRKTWALFLAYLIGASGYIYYLYVETQSVLTDNINNKLLHAALGASAILGDRYHDNLVDKQSKSQAQDWDTIQRLSGFNESMGTAFVYSVIKRDAKAYLISSSASKKKFKRRISCVFSTLIPMPARLYSIVLSAPSQPGSTIRIIGVIFARSLSR